MQIINLLGFHRRSIPYGFYNSQTRKVFRNLAGLDTGSFLPDVNLTGLSTSGNCGKLESETALPAGVVPLWG